MSPVKLRYYQARVALDPEVLNLAAMNAEAPDGGPPALGVTERVVFTPDEAVHLCEATPSTWMDVLDYSIEFGPGVTFDDMPAEVASYWQDVEIELMDDERGYYVHRSSVVARWDQSDEGVEFTDVYTSCGVPVLQGEYADDEDGDALDQAREDAQGNHYV